MAAKRAAQRSKDSTRKGSQRQPAAKPKKRKLQSKKPKRPKQPKRPRRPRRPHRPERPPRPRRKPPLENKPDSGSDDTPTTGGGAAPAGTCGLIPIDDSIEQEQVNWCWAACVDVVVRFRQSPVPQLQQCDVATRALGAGAHCCSMAPVHCVSSQGGASAGPCDVPRDNAQITSLFRSFAINAWEDARLTEATLRSELTLGKLVGVHISWGGASGHMLLIYGCKGATMFSVYDPCLGAESYTYSEIVNYGDGEGTWDLTWRDL